MPLFDLQIWSSLLLAHRHVCLLIGPRRGDLQALSHHRLSSLLVHRTFFFVMHKFTHNFTDPYTTNQPCAPQCLYVLRAYAITGAKRLSLLIYLPCLFAYLFFVSWHSLSGVTLVKEVFLISGRSGCFPDRYNRYFVCFMSFLHRIHDRLITTTPSCQEVPVRRTHLCGLSRTFNLMPPAFPVACWHCP